MLSSYAVDKSVILFRPGDIIPLLGGRRAWNYDDLGPLPDRMEVAESGRRPSGAAG